ncbi:roadblock/LC7 domain-containing protein [Thermodesulfobacteriota bacterium B35]
MTRKEQLDKALASLQAASADIEACAVVSEDGLIIASALPQGLDEERIAAMSAVLLSMGSRTVAELQRGELEQLFVKGGDGYIIMSHAGPHGVLIALTSKTAKLGLIFLDMSRCADDVEKILS